MYTSLIRSVARQRGGANRDLKTSRLTLNKLVSRLCETSLRTIAVDSSMEYNKDHDSI